MTLASLVPVTLLALVGVWLAWPAASGLLRSRGRADRWLPPADHTADALFDTWRRRSRPGHDEP